MAHYSKKVKNRPVIEVTKNLNKKGRIKGKNKKETKALKGMCVHHKLNNKGRIKPTLVGASKGYCYCSLCGARVPTKFFQIEDKVLLYYDSNNRLKKIKRYTADEEGKWVIKWTKTW